jgi:hypothetical protein
MKRILLVFFVLTLSVTWASLVWAAPDKQKIQDLQKQIMADQKTLALKQKEHDKIPIIAGTEGKFKTVNG